MLETWNSHKPTHMATITIACKICGSKFPWNDRWPIGLKRCPLCGMTDNVDGDLQASGSD
jgi:endogenous inhibitor of DNA gyrase (YacG/DUF329 family)